MLVSAAMELTQPERVLRLRHRDALAFALYAGWRKRKTEPIAGAARPALSVRRRRSRRLGRLAALAPEGEPP